MIDRETDMSISHQCRMLQIHRSGLYYTPCVESEENLLLMRLLDEQYFKTPFYGVRKLTIPQKSQTIVSKIIFSNEEYDITI